MFSPAEMMLKNRLLMALPETDWKLWEPRLKPVELASGQVIYD
jgi:hypothetical protein